MSLAKLPYICKIYRRRSERGFSEYMTWRSMWKRCIDPTVDSFKYYGGRGITICDEWKDFEVFLKDMGYRPKGTSLDRRLNNQGYTKENCRWATNKQQSHNSRSTRNIWIKGKVQPLTYWLKEYSDTAVRQRGIYEFGLPLHEAFDVAKNELFEFTPEEAYFWHEGALDECYKLYLERTGKALPIL